MSCTNLIAVAGRQPSFAGPTCCPCGAASHAEGHTACTVMYPCWRKAMRKSEAFFAAALEEFGDLRREEPLQPRNTFGSFLRYGELVGHVVEARRESLQFVAR